MEDCTHENLDRCVKLSYSVTTAERQEAGGTGREGAKLSVCSHRGRGGNVVDMPSALGSCGEKGEELLGEVTGKRCR